MIDWLLLISCLMSPGPSVCVSGVGVVDGVTRVDVDAVEGVRRVPACPARRLTPGSRGNYSLLLVGVGTLQSRYNKITYLLNIIFSLDMCDSCDVGSI